MSREMVVDDVASNYDRRLRVWPKVIGKNEGLVWRLGNEGQADIHKEGKYLVRC